MSKAALLLLTLLCSFITKADYDPAIPFTCDYKKMDLVSPYMHYLARLSHLRVKLSQQNTDVNLHELDSILLETITTIKKSECNGEATLDSLKKLKKHFKNVPIKSKTLSQKLYNVLAEMGV